MRRKSGKKRKQEKVGRARRRIKGATHCIQCEWVLQSFWGPGSRPPAGASCRLAPTRLVLTRVAGREQASRRLLSTVAGSVGGVIAVAILIYLYWRWELAPVSRRLIGARKGEEANQKDLPYELRKKYEAVTVLGSGSFGVVIAAWQLSDGKRTIRRAIKLVHARHRKFEEKDLRRLNREVNLKHTYPRFIYYFNFRSRQSATYYSK
jgi:hypothetical protein